MTMGKQIGKSKKNFLRPMRWSMLIMTMDKQTGKSRKKLTISCELEHGEDDNKRTDFHGFGCHDS